MRFFKDCFLAALITVGVLLIVELGFRAAGVKYTGSFFNHEPERGYSYRPNARGWAVNEGDNFLTVNSDGMVDRERSVARPPGVLRIAVLGSSEVAAEQMPRDRTFEAEMERQLARALHRPAGSVEVLNFGVAGYNLQQEYLTLHHHVWKYQPDIVLLGTTSMALIRSVPTLFPDYVPGTPMFDCDHIPEGDSPPPAPRLSFSRRLRNRLADFTNQSRVLLALNEAHTNALQLIAKYRAKLSRSKPKPQPANASLPTTDSIYNPDDPIYAKSWQVEECIVRAMKRDCDRHHAEFFVVVFDRSREIDPDPRARAVYARKIGVSSLFLTDERMAELAQKDGISAILLGPPLLRYVEQNHIVLHGFYNTAYNMGHWNFDGNRAAGEVITQALLDQSQVLQANRTSASAGRVTLGAN
ncbi:MAG TPA: hypothetical protein VKX25_20610 [Bryobacteraceae bacterium]|jgi:hypothetical protein|nr:hypothetical protein [Bryobacteraceae bacterium]